MKLCIVPMKPLEHAKARLADVLTPEERRALSLAMLRDVVGAARALDVVWVLNSDDDAAEVARDAGAVAVPDPTPSEGLNASLDAATARAVTQGLEGVLIVSADCPAATADDVRALAVGPGVMLAPDRTGKGTNALWRAPPDAIGLAFGPGSAKAHMSICHRQGVSFAVVPRARLALDIDRPADLDAAWDTAIGEATRTALRALGYPERRTTRR